MGGKEKILIIDDEIGPREAMRMILKDLYNVRTASGGREGLAQLAAGRVDLVIVDIKMPDMDGISVLKEIKKEYTDTEVVLVTAYASLETARSAIRYGAFEYLIKPFDKDDVLHVVEKGLTRRSKSRQSQTEMEDLLLVNRNLEKQVEDARQNFMLCYGGTIKALIYAIDAKDHYTYNHSRHVADLSARIADLLGFSSTMKNNIKQAALIHDIGKIGIDEQILRKKGTLTKNEFSEIMKHPEIGERIVKSVPFMEEAAQVILYHHERFDGSGFPRGLKGDRIPMPVAACAS
jgi:putative nucleotidyltransferase with HDIG domain